MTAADLTPLPGWALLTPPSPFLFLFSFYRAVSRRTQETSHSGRHRRVKPLRRLRSLRLHWPALFPPVFFPFPLPVSERRESAGESPMPRNVLGVRKIPITPFSPPFFFFFSAVPGAGTGRWARFEDGTRASRTEPFLFFLFLPPLAQRTSCMLWIRLSRTCSLPPRPEPDFSTFFLPPFSSFFFSPPR